MAEEELPPATEAELRKVFDLLKREYTRTMGQEGYNEQMGSASFDVGGGKIIGLQGDTEIDPVRGKEALWSLLGQLAMSPDYDPRTMRDAPSAPPSAPVAQDNLSPEAMMAAQPAPESSRRAELEAQVVADVYGGNASMEDIAAIKSAPEAELVDMLAWKWEAEEKDNQRDAMRESLAATPMGKALGSLEDILSRPIDGGEETMVAKKRRRL